MKPKNLKRNIQLLLLATISGLVVMVACNKKLDVTDQNNPTTESYFKTAERVTTGR